MVRLRTPGPALALGTALALVLPLSPASAEDRYAETVRGGLAVTGNTLGLSKASSANGPGTLGSIGTFIAVGSAEADADPVNPGNPWFAGTTASWEDNASAAVLALPAGATVTYAELAWGGSYDYSDSVAASLDTSVELAHGITTPVAVTPDPATAVTLSETSDSFQVRHYTRSADVTDYVAAHGPGTYTVGHVPATQHQSINSLNAAGWSLAVAYTAPGAPLRHVALDVSGAWVDTDQSHDVAFPGACAATGGSLVTAAVEGDADLTGDQLLAGPTPAELSTLSGPNNPVSNLFASQLNAVSGALDPTGTFGDRNQDASLGVNASGARQGTDVTTLPLPGSVAGEEDLVVRYRTDGDSFLPMLTGIAVDNAAPFVTAAGAGLSPGTLRPGGNTTLSVPITNSGDTAALGTTFSLALPAGVTATRLTVDGNAKPVSQLAAGTLVGTLPVGGSRSVTVALRSTRTVATALSPVLDYSYTDCTGGAAFDSTTLTRAFAVDAVVPRTTLTEKPKKRSTKARATFRFSSSESGTFQCSLDGRAFAACSSGRTYKVKVGKHTFKVRAVDRVGNVDASPATYAFTRKKPPKG